MALQVVILAAGRGKRMHSTLPKVLHRIADKPMLNHVLATARQLSSLPPIVIYGHEGETLRQAITDKDVKWVEQKEQLGTGHALQQALPIISSDDQVLVLYGDVPLISNETLKKLLAAMEPQSMAMLTAHLTNPSGYGRIKRNAKGTVECIIEEKDASPHEKTITEINPGIYLVPANLLKKWLPNLNNQNAQQEYYLTDIINFAVKENITVNTVQPLTHEEIQGVNDRLQLAYLERFHQKQIAEKLLKQGVSLADPNRLDVRGEVDIGRDVYIDINVIFEGRVKIGDHCRIGPNCVLRNTVLGNGVEIKSHSLLDEAQVADEAIIGPFARLRPGTQLGKQVHIGNFVEIKKSVVAEKSKINHLSYIGDATIGKHVNIGAGTITCNYDGVNKHQTIIEDNAFIGSNTQLVAPVKIGEGATIGAGSTIVKDAPKNRLTLARSMQITLTDWKRPEKNK